jgi:hypothetical protein
MEWERFQTKPLTPPIYLRAHFEQLLHRGATRPRTPPGTNRKHPFVVGEQAPSTFGALLQGGQKQLPI